jgi:hypothetical protein
MASGGTDVLHALNLTDEQGDYRVRDFAHDHPTVVDWGIDALSATAGGLAAVAASETGPGAIIAGAAAGAAVETGLRGWLGDESYGRNIVRGAVIGGGAGAAVKLQSFVADKFGAGISSLVDRHTGQYSPLIGVTVSRLVLPGSEAVASSSFAGKVSVFGADRIRGNLYFQTTTRTTQEAVNDMKAAVR